MQKILKTLGSEGINHFIKLVEYLDIKLCQLREDFDPLSLSGLLSEEAVLNRNLFEKRVKIESLEYAKLFHAKV